MSTYSPHDSEAFEFSSPRHSLTGHVRTIFRKKWLFLGIVALALAGGVVVGLVRSPVYKSSAILRVELGGPSQRGLQGALEFFAEFSIFYETQVQSLKEMAQSGSLSTPDRRGLEDAAKALPRWSDIRITENRGSQLINVEASANDPFAAREKLRDYLEQYIRADRERLETLANSLLAKLQNELRQAEERMRKSQEELVNFAREHGMVLLDDEPELESSLLETAGKTFLDIRNERLNLETLTLHKQMILPKYIDNEFLSTLKKNSAALKADYVSAASVLGSGHFQHSLAQGKLYAMEKAISEVEQSEIASSLEAAKKRESAALQAYELAKEAAIRAGSNATRLSILKRAAAADAQVYLTLTQKIKQMALFSRLAPHTLGIEGPPTLPTKPVFPDWRRIIAASLFVGLFGAIVVILGPGMLSTGVKTSGDIKELGLPVLGVIPDAKSIMRGNFGGVSGFSYELSPHYFPLSLLTDALHVVRENIASALKKDEGAAICVTSSLPSEGKTFVATSLAATIASERNRVIVIDGDLRNPRVSEVFKSSRQEKGLAEFLSGNTVSAEEIIRQSTIPGLFYVLAGNRPDNPVALLKSPRFGAFLQHCIQTFDLVIVDAPPVLGFADAAILAKSCTGALMVVRQGFEKMELIKDARDTFRRLKIRILGAMLNFAETDLPELGFIHDDVYSGYAKFLDKPTQ
ncbi:GumC family protein [Desulfomonile tiedjei]|uniref:Capsular exopolysaccharide biosynthesis protein n=1 Tax=Desulfomonile tiedjei (strain ATCC 49306 / DSM 6799 / DCB-1) TaxID=706587 RepID=I4CBA7_DESTA|nr:polysaccharide biosynthesis tyrosine autokinase [Desulfomonile tiedjei]AFM26848.1 capsular exopolysaccharide biosynthesis protein [Desulfomonile tiedjei DSM 6799]